MTSTVAAIAAPDSPAIVIQAPGGSDPVLEIRVLDGARWPYV